MTTIAVTGASGHLGRLTIAALLEGVPADQIVAVVRDASRVADLADRGIQVRVATYGDPAALGAALTGVDRLLIISGSEVGRRIAQHKNVVDAAVSSGVQHIAYTSAPHADHTTLVLAPEHHATEQLIIGSGLGYTLLRNNWYTENYLGSVEQARTTGVLIGSAGAGRVASATRADFAEAAAVVVASDRQLDPVYELGGDVAWSFDDLAAAISDIVGTAVRYENLSHDDHVAALIAAGLPTETAGFVAALDANISEGTLDGPTGQLSALIGHPTTSLLDGLRNGLPTTARG